jgi:hypothetical protein
MPARAFGLSERSHLGRKRTPGTGLCSRVVYLIYQYRSIAGDSVVSALKLRAVEPGVAGGKPPSRISTG